jgi:hypothetical protein
MGGSAIVVLAFIVVFPVIRKVGDERIHRVHRRRLGRILLLLLVVVLMVVIKQGEDVAMIIAARGAAGVEVVVVAAAVAYRIVPSRSTHSLLIIMEARDLSSKTLKASRFRK